MLQDLIDKGEMSEETSTRHGELEEETGSKATDVFRCSEWSRLV